MATNLAYPYRLDARGNTAAAGEEAYIRGLIEQVLFTAPGERPMRPDFGSGIMQLVFAPNSPELAATTQFLVQGALQQWLGDLIEVQSVDIEALDATLTLTLRYLIRRSGIQATETFQRGGAGP